MAPMCLTQVLFVKHRELRKNNRLPLHKSITSKKLSLESWIIGGKCNRNRAKLQTAMYVCTLLTLAFWEACQATQTHLLPALSRLVKTRPLWISLILLLKPQNAGSLARNSFRVENYMENKLWEQSVLLFTITGDLMRNYQNNLYSYSQSRVT